MTKETYKESIYLGITVIEVRVHTHRGRDHGSRQSGMALEQ